MQNRGLQNSQEAERIYFAKICQWLKTRTGLHFPPTKHATMLGRLYKLCGELGLASLAELHQNLDAQTIPNINLKLMDAATTNHTYFYREETVWKFFSEIILPKLLRQPGFRIWSAASSSGEEAYTFAMVIKERMASVGKSGVFNILGTDINPDSVQSAENGVYKENSMRSLPQSLKDKYVLPYDATESIICDDIKSHCVFRRLNLKTKPWPFSQKFDLIACRNVLYYFDTSDQEEVLERLYDNTAQDGWLLTSVTESLRDLNTRWELVTAGVYHKKRGK